MQDDQDEHITVMLQEAVDALNLRAAGLYVDATFGRGGHSRRILQQLGPQGRLLAFDQDPQAMRRAQQIEDPRFYAIHDSFDNLEQHLTRLQIDQLDGVLMDLGVSSPQLDDAERGFSFQADGPLDMRMNTTQGLTAAQWLAEVEEQELSRVIWQYGEERFARKIARRIVCTRQTQPLQTTRQLAALVAETVKTKEKKHPATRTFQAIRIFLNRELEALEQLLSAATERLACGGRLVAISFHSLEDRMVKQFIRKMAQGDAVPASVPLREDQIAKGRLRAIGKAQKPCAQEIAANPRARSAVMRVAERTDAA